MNRRVFIKQSSLAVSTAAIVQSFSLWRNEQPMGIQLYSLRENIKKDVEGTLKKIAEIGFKEIETFGYSLKNKFWGVDARKFKVILDKLGLNSPSGHYNFGGFLQSNSPIDDFHYVIEVANILNQEYIIIPIIPKDLRG